MRNVKTNIFYYTIGGVTLIVFLLRFYFIDIYPFWSDEILTHSIAANPVVSDVIKESFIRSGGNALLYNTSLHFWLSLLGDSIFNGRILSFVCIMVATIGLFKLTDQNTENRKLAFLVAILFFLNPLVFRYGQELRTYAFTTMLIVIQATVFIALIRNESKFLLLNLAFSLLTLGAFFSHYLVTYIFLAEFLVLVSTRKISLAKKIIIAATTLTIGIALFFLLDLPSHLELLLGRSNQIESGKIKEMASLSIKPTPYYLAAGIIQNFLVQSGNYLQNFGIKLIYLIPFATLNLILFSIYFRKKRVETIDKILILVIGCYLFQAIVLALLSGHITSFQVNYGIFLLPFFSILLGRVLFYYLISYTRLISFSIGAYFITILIVGQYPVISDYGKERVARESIKNELNEDR